MINEKDLQDMTKAEINKLQKMIDEENKRRDKSQYQQIAKEFDKLIHKANDLCMGYTVNGEEMCFASVSLDKNDDLVFEFWD